LPVKKQKTKKEDGTATTNQNITLINMYTGWFKIYMEKKIAVRQI